MPLSSIVILTTLVLFISHLCLEILNEQLIILPKTHRWSKFINNVKTKNDKKTIWRHWRELRSRAKLSEKGLELTEKKAAREGKRRRIAIWLALKIRFLLRLKSFFFSLCFSFSQGGRIWQQKHKAILGRFIRLSKAKLQSVGRIGRSVITISFRFGSTGTEAIIIYTPPNSPP